MCDGPLSQVGSEGGSEGKRLLYCFQDLPSNTIFFSPSKFYATPEFDLTEAILIIISSREQ